MEKHVNVTGILWIVSGALGFITGFILIAILFGAGVIVGIADPPDAEVPIGILMLIGLVLGGSFLVFSIPDIVAGIGLLKYKEWARILTLVLSIINLLNIPIGTAIGGYSLWVLFHKDTVPLFQKTKST